MLSSRLISLRKENKKTQDEIAKFLGITRPAYTAYETGRRQPDYNTLIKIASFYEVSIDFLLGNTDERLPANLIKEKINQNNNKPVSDPFLDDLLKRVPDLTEKEKESLADHLEFAMKLIEKERKERSKER